MEDGYLPALLAGLQPGVVDGAQLGLGVEKSARCVLVDHQLAVDAVAHVATRATLRADVVPPITDAAALHRRAL